LSELDSLIESLLSQVPNLTREELDAQIRLKKERIGAGYLTDQGAVFLVASDHGVALGETVTAEVDLKELTAGVKEVTFKAKVLSISSIRHITKKDGSPLLLRTMIVYDDTVSRTVNMWDDHANIPILSTLKPGDLIRISKAYTKADTRGDIAINMSSNTAIEKLDEDSSIPDIDAITKDVGLVVDGQRNLAVVGTIDGRLNKLNFTNAQGQPRKAIKMNLKGAGGESVSVVLWGKDESNVPQSVPVNAKTRLLGVYAKTGRQGTVEIHGNEDTVIQMEGGQEPAHIIVRVLSYGRDTSDNIVILGVDRNKNLLTLYDTSGQTEQFKKNDIIECMPSKSFGNSISINESSYVSAKEDDPEIPHAGDIRTKIKDIKIGGLYCTEAIILKKPELREISTKAEEQIQLGEMFVEDDTCQIWVKGWRNLATLLTPFESGQIVSIVGAEGRAALDGQTELVLMSYTSISLKEEPSPPDQSQ